MNPVSHSVRSARIAPLASLPALAMLSSLAQAQGLPTLEDPSRELAEKLVRCFENNYSMLASIMASIMASGMAAPFAAPRHSPAMARRAGNKTHLSAL